MVYKYIGGSLLDDVLEWKKERNRLIHAPLKQEPAHNEASELARQGKALVGRLRTRPGNFNWAVERQKAKAGL